MAGTESSSNLAHAVYWKNGEPVNLTELTYSTFFIASDIAVSSKGVIHAVGHNVMGNGQGKYWKDGVETHLTYSTLGGYKLALAEDDVYIISPAFDASKYWKNGKIENFTNDSGAVAYAIVTVPR